MTAPYFPKYAKDWLTGEGTRLMTPEQRGAFDTLLCHAWLSDPPCTLPDDDVALAKLSDLGRRWKTAGKDVRSQFQAFPGAPGRIYNPKQLTVWSEMEEHRQRRSDAGKKGNALRWNGDSQSDRNAITNGSPSLVGVGASEVGISSPLKFEPEKAFDEFWRVVLDSGAPKPVHKSAAQRAFAKSVPDFETLQRVYAAQKKYAASGRVQKGFVQDASTWLNDWQQWENWKEPVAASPIDRVESIEPSPEVKRMARATFLSRDIHDWIGSNGDPDVSDNARRLFNQDFADEIKQESESEDLWAKWLRVAGELGVTPKPDRRQSA
jgi:uncharacterized protein YdaU (DUF1376 family)